MKLLILLTLFFGIDHENWSKQVKSKGYIKHPVLKKKVKNTNKIKTKELIVKKLKNKFFIELK